MLTVKTGHATEIQYIEPRSFSSSEFWPLRLFLKKNHGKYVEANKILKSRNRKKPIFQTWCQSHS